MKSASKLSRNPSLCQAPLSISAKCVHLQKVFHRVLNSELLQAARKSGACLVSTDSFTQLCAERGRLVSVLLPGIVLPSPQIVAALHQVFASMPLASCCGCGEQQGCGRGRAAGSGCAWWWGWGWDQAALQHRARPPDRPLTAQEGGERARLSVAMKSSAFLSTLQIVATNLSGFDRILPVKFQASDRNTEM